MTVAAFQTWVVQTGVVVSLLILVVLIIRRPFARAFGANAAYALWSLPLIRLFMPGVAIPQNWLPSFAAPEAAITPVRPYIFPADMPPVPRDMPNAMTEAVALGPGPINWGVIVMMVWVTIAVLWFVYQLYRQYQFKTAVMAESRNVGSALSEEIERAAQKIGLRKTPLVRVSNKGLGPFVTGLRTPLVLLPDNFEQAFTAQQRHFALVHEFAHVRRGDLWVAMMVLIFRAVNWPNPLVHFATQKLRGDQEAACDAFVVKMTGGKTAHSYAETLVKAAGIEGRPSQPSAHLALSLMEADNEISKGD